MLLKTNVSHLNPIQTIITLYFLLIRIDIILPSMPRFPKCYPYFKAILSSINYIAVLGKEHTL